MALHKAWVEAAVARGLARYENAEVTINDVPNKGDKHKEAFKRVVFSIDGSTVLDLYNLADAERGVVKDEDGNEVPGENPVNDLLTYAYGLNCRAKVRTQYEAKFVDPEKGDKDMASKLVKSGRFKSFEKALAAVKLMHEDDE